MINWDKTFELFGYSESDRIPKHQKVVCQCDICGKIKLATKQYHYRSIRRSGEFRCRSCGRASSKEKISKALKSKWRDKEYRSKQESRSHTKELKEQSRQRAIELWQDEEYKSKYENGFNSEVARANLEKARDKSISATKERLKLLWQDEEYRAKMGLQSRNNWRNIGYRSKVVNSLQSHYNDEDILHELSEKARERWNNEDYRNNIINKLKAKWQDVEYKTKMVKAMADRPKVSRLQELLYSILDDLGIIYYRERNDGPDDVQCAIGPYSFDCCIPMQNRHLLIDCHGDYWHSRTDRIRIDKSKATYISQHFHNKYDYKIIWGHEFRCKDKIVDLIKYWTGRTQLELVDYDFKNIEIHKCPAKDYKLLLSKYHYLPNAGRGGIAYGAYLGHILIATCIFSPLIRQNLPWDGESTRELSRLCIHPRFQKKNLASWFISRCIKKLNAKYKTIISYCDTTFNHSGSVYLASNFRFDGKIKPDYWYISEDGWVMHKKTLYNYAIKQSMTESEFATLKNYHKVYGKEKLRFIYNRNIT